MRESRLKTKYGITEGDYARLMAAQDGRCWICEKRFTGDRLAAVDHRHSDGLIRGLLCVPCNDALGQLHENARWLRRASMYLDKTPAIYVIGHKYVPNSPGAAGYVD